MYPFVNFLNFFCLLKKAKIIFFALLKIRPSDLKDKKAHGNIFQPSLGHHEGHCHIQVVYYKIIRW